MKTARELKGGVRAFTLVEIMIVVAILGVILAMGVPPLLKAARPDSIRKAATDIRDVCNNARARAILNGTAAEVVFHPKERKFAVGGVATSDASGSPIVIGAGLMGELPPDVKFDLLDVNLRERKEDVDPVRVRFFPNGTSDEMTVIVSNDKNETRAVTLEVTTGLADIETDVKRILHK